MPKKKKSHRNKSPKKIPVKQPISLLRRWLAIGGLTVLALLLSSQIPITKSYTSALQNVLGDEDKKEENKVETKEEKREENKGSENKQEEQKKSEEKKQEEIKKQAEQKVEPVKLPKVFNQNTSVSSGEAPKTRVETISPDGVRTKSRSVGNKQETEIRTADGQKIKTKIEDDGTTKIEVENGTVKLKYKVENGQVVRKAENEEGEEIEMKDDELDELEDALEQKFEDDDLSLDQVEDNKLSVTKNQVTAVTDFPLSIDVATKQLVVTTPQGQKPIAILPDQAVQNLLAMGIINAIVPQNAGTATQDQLGSFDGTVKLETQNDKVIYKIDGKKTHRLFGLIPVTTPVTAIVSADTGATVSRQQSLLASVVDFLSP